MSFHVEFKLDLDNVRHLLTFELLMVNVFKQNLPLFMISPGET